MEEKKMKRAAARQVFQEQLVQNAMEVQEPLEVAQVQMQKYDNLVQNVVPELFAAPVPASAPCPSPIPQNKKSIPKNLEQKTSEELQLEKEGLQVRETGWWLWRTVVVPPNAYVVHTRRGHQKPITLGLGLSFRFRPRTDSYLVVPSALQTIGIVAQGISKEKQGINILAYVQWLISDFSIAYQRLDFSDFKDPVGIVNAQLREQAEAAIKDKIATMTVDEILTDKAPIIEELTQRMKAVAEGNNQGNRLSGMGGLGVQIVTVQIKEAFVSSQRLWEMLQAPFRNQAEREARLSRLRIEEEVRQQELTNKRRIQTGEAQIEAEIEKCKAEKESEAAEIVSRERIKRKEFESREQQQSLSLEEESQIQRQLSENKLEENRIQSEQRLKLLELQQEQQLLVEKSRMEAERELKQKEILIENQVKQLELEERLKEIQQASTLKDMEHRQSIQEREYAMAHAGLERNLLLQSMEQDHRLAQEQKSFQLKKAQEEENERIQETRSQHEIARERSRQEICNAVSSNDLLRRFIEALPPLAQCMPEIHELKTLQISSDSSKGDTFSILATYLARMIEIGKGFGLQIPGAASPKGSHSNDQA